MNQLDVKHHKKVLVSTRVGGYRLLVTPKSLVIRQRMVHVRATAKLCLYRASWKTEYGSKKAG